MLMENISRNNLFFEVLTKKTWVLGGLDACKTRQTLRMQNKVNLGEQKGRRAPLIENMGGLLAHKKRLEYTK